VLPIEVIFLSWSNCSLFTVWAEISQTHSGDTWNLQITSCKRGHNRSPLRSSGSRNNYRCVVSGLDLNSAAIQEQDWAILI